MKQRLLLFAFTALISVPYCAQKDFASLPARQKTQMAEEEQIASESDAAFQALMTEGMHHFEKRNYEGAIEKFEEAGKKRPINVYPPVMIEDVKLAMDKPEPEEEKPAEEPIAEKSTKSIAPEMSAEERVELAYQQELAKVYDKKPDDSRNKELAAVNEQIKKSDERKKAETTSEGLVVRDKEDIIADGGVLMPSDGIMHIDTKKDPVKVQVKEEAAESALVEEIKTVKEVQEELGATYPDGITEEVFTEGNRTITKRVVVQDGLGNEYRMVKHGWGGVFYFKNNTSITERVWNEETVKH